MLMIVTPCKGRLAHVRQTAPENAPQADRYVFVDYDCPERSGRWVATHVPNSLVVPVTNAPEFSKTRAHNAGARAAIDAGATWLVFADADTIMGPGTIEWIYSRLQRGRFIIAGREHRDLTGLLALHVRDFVDVNGFDETFRGWGAEDLDMRLRLRLALGLDYSHVPPGYLVPIEHDDSLRTAHYADRNRQATNARNMARVFETVLRLTGDPSAPSRLDVRQLLGDPGVTPQVYRAESLR